MFKKSILAVITVAIAACATSGNRRSKRVKTGEQTMVLFSKISEASNAADLEMLATVPANRAALTGAWYPLRKLLLKRYFARLVEFHGDDWLYDTCSYPGATARGKSATFENPIDAYAIIPKTRKQSVKSLIKTQNGMSLYSAPWNPWGNSLRPWKQSGQLLRKHLESTLKMNPSTPALRKGMPQMVTALMYVSFYGCDSRVKISEKELEEIVRITDKLRSKPSTSPEQTALFDKHLPLKRGKLEWVDTVQPKLNPYFAAEFKKAVADENKLPMERVAIAVRGIALSKTLGDAELEKLFVDQGLRLIELFEADRVRPLIKQSERSCVAQAAKGKQVGCELPRSDLGMARLYSQKFRYGNEKAPFKRADFKGHWAHKACGSNSFVNKNRKKRNKLNPDEIAKMAPIKRINCLQPNWSYQFDETLGLHLQTFDKKNKARRGRYKYASMAKKEDLLEFFTKCNETCLSKGGALAKKANQKKAEREAKRKKQDEANLKCEKLSKVLAKSRLKWKKCMSREDLKSQARRYAVTDKELYTNHMQKKAWMCAGRAQNSWKKSARLSCGCYNFDGEYTYKLGHRNRVGPCEYAQEKWGPK